MDKFIKYCADGDLINAKKYFEENPYIDIHAQYIPILLLIYKIFL
jgi:hypothetical protein